MSRPEHCKASTVHIYAGATLALAQTSLKCSNRRVACVRFSPDSSVLAVGTADKTIDVYDVTSGFIHGGTLTGAAGVVLAMDFGFGAAFASRDASV